MEQVQVFNNEEFGSVRGILKGEDAWFVGSDIATRLAYTNPQKAIRDHVFEEDKLTERIVLSGQNRNVILINESGMLCLVLSSKLPKAREFKYWVTKDVLPSIRKTGIYIKLNENEYLRKDWMIDTLVDFKERCFIPLKNKAKLVDLLEVSDDCILIGDFAKLMCQNGIDTSRPKAFAELREHGWLMKKGKENLPTQKAINAGYLKIKETISDSGAIFRTPVITGKGQVHFLKQAIKILERRKAVSE